MKKDEQFYILLILSIVFIPAAYVFVAAVFIVQIYRGEYKIISYIKSNKYLLIVMLYIIIGVVFSNYLIISLLYGIIMLLCMYSVGLTAVYIERISIKKMKKLIYIVSLVVFIIGIAQYLNPHFVMPQKWVDVEEFKLKKRIFSTFFNPNVFGFYINIILIILCGEINIKDKSYKEIVLFALGLVCMFLTFSRATWISLVVSLVISGILFDKKYFKFALFVFVVIIGFDKILNIGRSNPVKMIEDSSMMYRIEIWKACFSIVKDNMLTGIGFGTLFKYISSYSDIVKPNIEHCHNLYIQVLTESGIIGFGGFIFIIFKLISNTWREAKKRNNQRWITSFSIIVMVLVHGTVDSVSLTPQIMMILSVYIGYMFGMERIYKNFSFITFQ
ncbi:O-antigen ligase family protein [Sedimentibacter acidaminivorans]|nr:O-antigen ligase family protein [Sedimentibacter acidaminivorans]